MHYQKQVNLYSGEFKAAPLRGADLNSISDARISEADSESNGLGVQPRQRHASFWSETLCNAMGLNLTAITK